MTARNAIFFLPALALVACAPEAELDELSPDEQVAMAAAIQHVQPLRTELPIEDEELEVMAISNIEEARDYSNCEVQGVLSGVWYDEELAQVFEGSWFELGTGDLGGTLEGSYAEGAFSGTFDGGATGGIEGEYADGLFLGDWAEVDPDATVGATGELIGRYERRNDYGGYFFGQWGQCP